MKNKTKQTVSVELSVSDLIDLEYGLFETWHYYMKRMREDEGAQAILETLETEAWERVQEIGEIRKKLEGK